MGSGCGADDGSASVTVETGSLSKKEFIKRADAICTARRSEFTREYTTFYQKAIPQDQPPPSVAEQKVLLGDLVNEVFLPTFQQVVDEISALGAPKGDEQEVSSILTVLQERLDEIEEKPRELSQTLEPLSEPAKLADAYGLVGCRSSFGGGR